MSEEWKEGYAKGFQDGYDIAKRELHRSPINPVWPGSEKPYCKVCGMDRTKPMSLVCYHPQCPGRITCNTGQPYNSLWSSAMASTVVKDPGPMDGMSYEEIYGSVIYQQNKNKEE